MRNDLKRQEGVIGPNRDEMNVRLILLRRYFELSNGVWSRFLTLRMCQRPVPGKKVMPLQINESDTVAIIF